MLYIVTKSWWPILLKLWPMLVAKRYTESTQVMQRWLGPETDRSLNAFLNSRVLWDMLMATGTQGERAWTAFMHGKCQRSSTGCLFIYWCWDCFICHVAASFFLLNTWCVASLQSKMTGDLGTWSAKSTGDLRANDRLPYLSVLGFYSKMLRCFNAMDPGLVPPDL